MFGVISFGFKILFASIIGGALSYIPDESKNNQDILETSLICIFSASVLGLIRQLPNKGEYFAIGFAVLDVLIVVITMSKNFKFRQRIIWVFAAVVGMIIGYGFLKVKKMWSMSIIFAFFLVSSIVGLFFMIFFI